ncbi:MAG: hypothetical protein CMJ64_24855 [Planctomycetaceae bacterium]|nr:hypothetical protein [Planctomycetaceae bacterium]
MLASHDDNGQTVPALAFNNGLTPTIALLVGGPAIDAGDSSLSPTDTTDLDSDQNTSEPLPLDQRGIPRLIDLPGVDNVGDGLDIGAFEFTDTTPPTMTAPPDITLEGNTIGGATQAAASAFFEAAVATDDLHPSPTITHDAPDPFPLGTTVVTFTAGDGFNDSTASATISVEDTTPPTLTVPDDLLITRNVAGGAEATLAAVAAFLGGATAGDLVDANPSLTHSAPTVLPIGTNLITFTAMDASGNVQTAEASIIVNVEFFDYGDAPSAYPVTFAQNGARHIVDDLHLGVLVDVEADGKPDKEAGRTVRAATTTTASPTKTACS